MDLERLKKAFRINPWNTVTNGLKRGYTRYIGVSLERCLETNSSLERLKKAFRINPWNTVTNGLKRGYTRSKFYL